MFIQLEKAMPNGAVGRIHVVEQLVVTAEGAVATVTTSTDLDGVVCWQDRIKVPAEQLTGDPLQSAAACLILPGAYLAGGAVLVAPTKLEQLKAAAITRLRRYRDEHTDGGCATAQGRVDTDPESRGKVSGAVQMAMIAMAAGEPFSIGWTMQDNATIAHDGPAMIAMGVAVGRHVAACHAEAVARRIAIEAAEDAAAIEAVPMAKGWPGEQ